MNTDHLNFISNNVKGLQGGVKRIIFFEYLKSKISYNGLVFLQETHSCSGDEKQWADEFKGKLFFSHGKTNSCGVAIGYYGVKPFTLISQFTDKNGRIVVVEVNLDDDVFVLINIYNSNTETEQLLTLFDLNQILENVSDLRNKKVIISGDFNFHFDSI